MSIKKPYVELVEFLQQNENKKVSSILEEILAMCESKKSSSTTIEDSDGNLIAIYCYYHKQWELISEVEYGSKANTKHGLNNMCKNGTSHWYKQQREAKKASTDLLDQVSSGDIAVEDIVTKQAEIEILRNDIDMSDAPKGFASEAELYEYLSSK